MKIARFFQYVGERKRYKIVYDDWLDSGETVASVAFDVSPATTTPFEVDSYVINTDGLSIAVFMQGGDDGETYDLLITATTSGGQIKESVVQFEVKQAE